MNQASLARWEHVTRHRRGRRRQRRLGGAFSGEEMKNQGDHRKNEEKMNEKAGDMVEEEAADPDTEQDDG